MSYNFEYAVFIGRFQPFHNGHLEIVKEALRQAEKLIIVIGSARSGRTIKNPFNFEERVAMIRGALDEHLKDRVVFTGVRDYFANDQLWLAALHHQVRAFTDESNSIALVGHYSDESSYYLNMFPQWKFISIRPSTKIHATEIRKAYFTKQDYSKYVPPNVMAAMGEFASPIYMDNPYASLVEEFNFTENYKAAWANAPYTPTFVTTDAVVIQSGHVLLVRRKFNPGKGKWALPGGFLQPNETVLDGALRELYEETRLLVPKEVTRAHIVGDPKVFDYPGRSLRGRTITHAICVKFKDDYILPQCKGADDAEKAVWVPIGDLRSMEENFFEDHLTIIEYWLNRVH